MSNLIFLESVVDMPLMSLPVRTVYVPPERAGVLLSPGSRLTTDQLKSVHLVTDLVAPSRFHKAGLPKAANIFPRAKIWSEEIKVEDWPYSSELKAIPLMGMPKVQETVFLHSKSKSLIVTDLCFNLVESRGLGAWVILNLFGTYKKLGVSRFFAKYIEDKTAFLNSIRQLLNEDFDHLIVSHGENIMGGAKARLRGALAERKLLP